MFELTHKIEQKVREFLPLNDKFIETSKLNKKQIQQMIAQRAKMGNELLTEGAQEAMAAVICSIVEDIRKQAK